MSRSLFFRIFSALVIVSTFLGGIGPAIPPMQAPPQLKSPTVSTPRPSARFEQEKSVAVEVGQQQVDVPLSSGSRNSLLSKQDRITTFSSLNQTPTSVPFTSPEPSVDIAPVLPSDDLLSSNDALDPSADLTPPPPAPSIDLPPSPQAVYNLDSPPATSEEIEKAPDAILDDPLPRNSTEEAVDPIPTPTPSPKIDSPPPPPLPATQGTAATLSNNWAVGNTVYLCKDTEIREGSGFSYDIHTTVPEDNWPVEVIDGPRHIDGETWWDISRSDGGTGWVYQSQADSCQSGPGGPGPGIDWAVGNIVGLCEGTKIHHGPQLPYHTIVPEDNWLVEVIGGPRIVNGETWWDTSRKATGDPSGGTGWVSQQQAEDACNGSGSNGYIGPMPLSPEERALYAMLIAANKYGSFLVGDPVYPPLGNHIWRRTILNVPGLGGFNFALEIACNSRDTRDGVFGTGCSSLLDTNLRLANDGSVDVRYPDGHGAYFRTEDDVYVPGEDGIYDTLNYDGSVFELTTPSQITYVFERFGADWLLTSLYDLYGNTISLERDGSSHVTRIVDASGREYPLTYAGEHAASITDPLGRTLRFEYENDDLARFIDGNGGVWRFEYENHRQTKLTDPEGILYLQNFYDGEGRVVEQIDAKGVHAYFDYSTDDQVIFTDNLGRQTTYFYDDDFQVTKLQDALGYTEIFAYDEAGNPVSYTDKRGNTWTYTWDGQGNMLTEDGPLGWHVAYTYNATNDLTSVTDALGRTTINVWENGNLVRVEYPDGTASTYTYDGHGQVLTATDPNGHTAAFGYDPHGNLVEIRSPLGCVTRYGYDAVGRLTSITNANGHTTYFAYDGNDNIVRITDPKGRMITFEYDGNDCLVKMTNRRGGVWTYAYDENLNLVSVTDPEGHTTTHTYDAVNNRISTTNPRGYTTYFRYDPLDRISEVEDPLGHVTRYEYDPNGNPVKVIDALTQATEYKYDALNRLVKIINPLGGVTEYEYDIAGRLVRMVNPRGFETRYEYDDRDRLVRVIDALGGVTEYTYDAAGNLIAVTDANGNTTHLRYDADDRLIEITDPEGHVTTFGYDCVGNLILVVNGRGYPTRYEYDENDNLVKVIDALGGEKIYAYDEEDNLVSFTDPNGNTTRFVYDLDGLLVQLIEAGGQTTRFEYDPAHNMVRLINAEGHATDYEYDPLNRLTRKIDPLGFATGYEYDPLGRLVAVTDALGTVTRYEYDPLNRLTAVVQNYRPGEASDHQTNVRTGYAYDAMGNLTAITDANGNITAFEYDPLDRLVREINPLGNAWRYEYDAASNLTRRIDANGAITDYTYDADDLLIGIHYPDGSEVTFSYDEAHNQVTMTEWLGATTNTYDALSRLISSTNHLGWTVSYAYDPAGNRVAVTHPDGRVVRTEYDETNYPVRVIDPDGNVFKASYDRTHNVVEILYPNLTRAVMAFDAAGQLVSVVNEQLDGDIISSFTYTLDAVGNRVHVDEYYRWHQPRQVSHDYAYDPLYRLVRSTDSQGRFTEYVYDAVGNRKQMTSNYDSLRTPTDVDPYTVDYTYNAANQLVTANHSVFGVTTYTYDGNGNRIRRQGPNVWTGGNDILRTNYTYDYENRLTWAGNFRDPGNGKWQVRDETSMVYDGYGRLFRRTHDAHQGGGGQKWTEFVYDGLDPIVEYVDPSPQYANYYRGLGRILEMHEYKSQESPVGTATYYHYDGLGSVSALTKHRGQAAHEYLYWDYGMVLDKNDRAADSSSFTNPHNHYTYTGQEWEEHTWLYHFYAREYDPIAGVWLQQDTYRGQLTEPGTLQRYGYTEQNPTNYIDEYGFCRTPLGSRQSLQDNLAKSLGLRQTHPQSPITNARLFLQEIGSQVKTLFAPEFYTSGAYKSIFRWDTYTDPQFWRRFSDGIDSAINFIQTPSHILKQKANESTGIKKKAYQLAGLAWDALPPISIPTAFYSSISADIKFAQNRMELSDYIGTQVESLSSLTFDHLSDTTPKVVGRNPNFGTKAFFVGKHTQRDALEGLYNVVSEWTSSNLGDFSRTLYDTSSGH